MVGPAERHTLVRGCGRKVRGRGKDGEGKGWGDEEGVEKESGGLVAQRVGKGTRMGKGGRG